MLIYASIMESVTRIEQSEAFAEELRRQRAFLEKNEVDLSQWGIGNAKPLDSLIAEIFAGECSLRAAEIDGSKMVIRQLKIITANVFHASANGTTFRLTEECQEFNDGRVRQRPHIEESVAEKMKSNENPTDTVLRGVREELSISINNTQVAFVDSTEKIRPSMSYPGIYNHINNYDFDVFLHDSQFNPDGYIEYRQDKISYFAWEQI